MRPRLFALVALAGACLFVSSCDPAANSNATNRPVNAANSNAAATTNNETDVQKFMAEVAAVLAKNDADAAAKFYAEDYHLVTPTGVVQTKAARLEDMRSGTTKFDSFAYENITVRSYGDIAVAISTVKAKGTIEGKPQDREIRATLVLRKGADGWKIVSGAATPIEAVPATTGASNTTSANNAAEANKPTNANK